MGGVVGEETLRHSRFLLRVSGFSILKKSPDKSQLHAELNSERTWIECGALFDFDLT